MIETKKNPITRFTKVQKALRKIVVVKANIKE
jgi:hypothetical protein